MKVVTFFALVFLVFGGSDLKAQKIDADRQYATGLMASFRSFCPTTGLWTANALAETHKIEKVLVSLRDDPKCTDVAQSIGVHVHSLMGALDRIAMSRQEREITSKYRQQLAVIQLLNSESDPGERQFLERLFRGNELALSLEEGQLEYDEKHARNQYLTSVAVNSSIQLFKQVSAGQSCLMKSPQLLSALFSIGK